MVTVFVNLADSPKATNYISWFSSLSIVDKIADILISIYATFLTLSTLIIYIPIGVSRSDVRVAILICYY